MSALTTFRDNYPEFADPSTYPDSAVQRWNSVAVAILDSVRWGATYDLGVQLYMAHNLSIDASRQRQGATGAAPGTSMGVLTAKQVETVYASYDPKFVFQERAGTYNMTSYGAQFYQLARMFGAGGWQL